MLETKVDINKPSSLDASIAHADDAQHQNHVDRELDTLLKWAEQTLPDSEFVRAKEEFFWKAGKVFHDDAFFEERMNYFVDYFLLQRPIETGSWAGYTVLKAYWEHHGEDTTAPCLESFQHSLFEIQRIAHNFVFAKDILSNAKVIITARSLENFRIIKKRELFQGYLYNDGSCNYLSRGIVFHPPKVVRTIRKTTKKMRKVEDFNELEFTFRLAKCHINHLRHAHVDPIKIYSEDTLK